MTEKARRSKCCNAEIRTDGLPDFLGSKEVCTVSFVCFKCNKPCDLRVPRGQRRKTEVTERAWSDPSLLRSLPNPSGKGYEIKIKNPEITFLGVASQPDYATVYITLYPKDTVIELRSLKLYFQQFRNKIISYERLVNVIYDDLMTVYKLIRLRIVMTLSPRGGISSRLTIDSDWKIRGGRERFRDWVGQKDEW